MGESIMPGSYNFFREFVRDFLKSKHRKDETVLDIGAGQGTFADLLKDTFDKIDGVEIHEPYISKFSLDKKYDKLFLVNILDFKFSFYNIIIMGDILEHLTVASAQELVLYLKERCDTLVVLVPYNYHQGSYEGNIYERHLQPDLSKSVMEERYPSLKFIKGNDKQGVFVYEK